MEFAKLVKNVGEDWAQFLKPFMCPDSKGYCAFDDIQARINDAYKTGPVFPEQKNIFRAFRETPFATVRVVLIGQDPYFKAGVANGICFATDQPVVPQALGLIYDTIERDVYNGLDSMKPARTGVLGRPDGQGHITTWMEQGVLCLNSALTVLEGIPDSHSELWRPFIQFIVDNLWRVKRGIIFVGWGARAKEILDFKKVNDKGTDGLSTSSGVNIFHAFLNTFEHPSAAGRDKRPWLCTSFSYVNTVIIGNMLGKPIQW